MDEALAERLDTIIALLNMAFAEPIERARDRVLGDPVKAAILEALAGGPMEAGPLQAKVSGASGQSERTVVRRLGEMVAQRIVIRTGSGSKVQYRSSGLIAAPAAKRATGAPTDD